MKNVMSARRSLALLAILMILVTLRAAPISQGIPSTTLTPRQILSRMANVYANCFSYRDEGKVVSTFEEISFATVFERPSSFRFEYRRSGPRPDRYIIWRTAPGDAQSWWTVRPETRAQKMNLAIATATGVSVASSHNIPRLLMPDEVDGFSLGIDDWVDAATSEESVNGRLCYKLSGHYPASPGASLTLWIDKETFLVRRIFSNNATVTYSPQLNVPIERSSFQFQPPFVGPDR